MSEKLSPLNDVYSVIFSSSGLGLNKDNAYCFKTNSANPISLSVPVCQNISCSLDACDVTYHDALARYCLYLRLTLYVSTVFFYHVGTFVQRRSCRSLFSANKHFGLRLEKVVRPAGK